METSGTFYVRNNAQKVLFTCELAGQFSDGFWENSSVCGWEDWCRADVVVDEYYLGTTFEPRYDRYNLVNGEFLSCVGNRMVLYVKISQKFGVIDSKTIGLIADVFDEDTGEYKGFRYSGDKYWESRRKEVESRFSEGDLRDVVNMPYSEKDMMSDLRDLKKIMKMRSIAREPAI